MKGKREEERERAPDLSEREEADKRDLESGGKEG